VSSLQLFIYVHSKIAEADIYLDINGFILLKFLDGQVIGGRAIKGEQFACFIGLLELSESTSTL